MGLLRQLQEDAVSRAVPLDELLRRCQILAFRLGDDAFKSWVRHELDGYGPDDELPPYRAGLQGVVKADTLNPARRLSNVLVPMTSLPEWYREQATSFEFRQSAAQLQALVEDARAQGHSNVVTHIPPEIYARIEIFEMTATVGMWSELPISSVSAILDKVRNTVLQFALELGEANPDEAEAAGEVAVPAEQVNHIYHTVISGGNVNWSSGSGDVTRNVSVSVERGGLESLMATLRNLGVGESDLEELDEAIREDAGAAEGGMGDRVSAWLGRVTMKLAAAGGRVGESAAGGLIAQALAAYFGVGVG